MTKTESFRGGIGRWVLASLLAAVVCAGLTYVITKAAVQSVYTATTTMQIQSTAPVATTAADPDWAVIQAQTYAAAAEQPSLDQFAYQIAAQSAVPGPVVSAASPSTSCQATPLVALFSCSVSAHSASFAARAAGDLARTFISREKFWTPGHYWSIVVVNPAKVPTSPSSPHPTLNAAVVLFLVFVLVFGYGLLEPRLPSWTTVWSGAIAPHPRSSRA